MSVPFWTIENMKVLHLSFHVGCLNDIDYIWTQLGHEVTGRRCWLPYHITPDIAQSYWEEHEEEFQSYDLILTSDTAALSFIFLRQAHQLKPFLWIYICNRWNYAMESEPLFLQYLQHPPPRVMLIPFSEFERQWCAQFHIPVSIGVPPLVGRSIPKQAFTIEPTRLVREFGQLVRTHERFTPLSQNIFIQSYFNHTQFMNLPEFLYQKGFSVHLGSYSHPSELKSYQALVVLPDAFQKYFMSESIQQKLLVFLPSTNFLFELTKQPRYFFNISGSGGTLQREWVNYCEWYSCPECRVYFDSWDDLVEKLCQVTYYQKLTAPWLDYYAEELETRGLTYWKTLVARWKHTETQLAKAVPRIYLDAYPSLQAFGSFRQIIIWGFTLHTHTHSYIHAAWYKVFKALGFQVYWWPDEPVRSTLCLENTCFLTEGTVDHHIPLLASCTYLVHIAVHPAKYLNQGARLLEIRYHVQEINDFNYRYQRPDTSVPGDALPLSLDTIYDIVPDDAAVALAKSRPITRFPYEVVYMYWATDLLPHEFDESKAERSRSSVWHYIGTVDSHHPFHAFAAAVRASGGTVVLHNPWDKPLSHGETQCLMQDSHGTPDFRSHGTPENRKKYGRYQGDNHLETGYIPCRVFKAISYGQTGLTNSPVVKALLGDYVEYMSNPVDAIPLVEKRMHDTAWRLAAMRHVAERHTFLQRAADLGRALTRPTFTCVTAYYPLNRETIDGRSVAFYKEKLLETVRIVRAPLILFLDVDLQWGDELRKASSCELHIIETSKAQLYMWKYLPQVNRILELESFRNKQKFPQDITNRLPEYTLIQYSKLWFLTQAMQENPYQTTQFCWLDAATCRFFPRNTRTLTPRHCPSRKFYVATHMTQLPVVAPDTYIGSNECILKGTCWLVDQTIWPQIRDEMMRIWEEDMLAQDRLDNEQIALALTRQKFPHLFEVVQGSTHLESLIRYLFHVSCT